MTGTVTYLIVQLWKYCVQSSQSTKQPINEPFSQPIIHSHTLHIHILRTFSFLSYHVLSWPQVMIPDHSMLRRILVQQCQRHSQHPDPSQRCLVVDMQTQKKSNSSRSDITSSRSEIMDVEPADSTLIMRKYAKSIFCFVPPGGPLIAINAPTIHMSSVECMRR